MVNKRIIKQVYENKITGQKLVGIPASSKIKPGDYVEITEVKK